MRYPSEHPTAAPTGLSENDLDRLMEIISRQEGIQFIGVKKLSFSRPALCFHIDNNGNQKVISITDAKKLLHENPE